MHISNRIKKVEASPIRKLTPYAAEAKSRGKKIYHLNIGQPDIVTPPVFLDAVHTYSEPIIAYGSSQGDDALLDAISDYYARWNMPYPRKGIFITNGGSEALQFAVLSICDVDDELMVFEPFYANYLSFATIYGVNINPVSTDVATGYRLPSEEVLERAYTPQTKAILITNPGNPTGAVYTEAELDMLKRFVLRHDLTLIVDEVYREFVYDGAFRSMGTMHELDQNLLMVDSISKRFSACGARIGALLTRNMDLAYQIDKVTQARLCPPSIEQAGAAALYTTPQSYLDEVRAEYKRRRDTLEEALSKLENVTFSRPQGAFYVMVDMPVDDAEKFAIWLLTKFELDGETMMFAPGNGFYSRPELGLTQARLAYVLNCQDLKRAIHILGEGLKAYPGRTK